MTTGAYFITPTKKKKKNHTTPELPIGELFLGIVWRNQQLCNLTKGLPTQNKCNESAYVVALVRL